MECIEKKLKKQMKTANNVPYPDFDQMWSSIQRNELKNSSLEPSALHPRKRKRFFMVAGISFALIATPVYATLTYDWSSMLSNRTGIQSALEQGLGQDIGQSITSKGVTLTIHTALIDDNRTFLLYSLKPDSSWEGKNVSFENIGLKDQMGNFIEGNYVQQWKEELGEYQGYFETDWVIEGQNADMEFTINNIQFLEEEKQFINYDPKDPANQVFPIQRDGIDSITVQSFKQSGERTLLQSSIMFTDTELKNNNSIRIQAINDSNKPIQEAKSSVLGTPGTPGEYLNQQTFESATLLAEGTKFQVVYNSAREAVEGTWSIKLALSKKQLENGSFRQVLNIPLDDSNETAIHEMVVTPTQIRIMLNHKEKYNRVPYMDYQLEVGGTLLNGGIWHLYVPGDPNKTEMRFEMVGLDLASLSNQPMALIAKHRVDEFKGDSEPIRLTDISAEHQSFTTRIAGYPIRWTYYMKDNNLYVESFSSDPAFGGVIQTYYLDSKEKCYGKPAIMGLTGDKENKRIDVYENFDQTMLDLYISNYTIHHRNDELRVQLKPGN
jgi:Domain of unknown function (DUF4179)